MMDESRCSRRPNCIVLVSLLHGEQFPVCPEDILPLLTCSPTVTLVTTLKSDTLIFVHVELNVLEL